MIFDVFWNFLHTHVFSKCFPQKTSKIMFLIHTLSCHKSTHDELAVTRDFWWYIYEYIYDIWLFWFDIYGIMDAYMIYDFNIWLFLEQIYDYFYEKNVYMECICHIWIQYMKYYEKKYEYWVSYTVYETKYSYFFLQIYDAVFPYTIYGPPYMIFFGANIWYFISNIMHDLHIWYFDDKIYENKNHMW